MSKYLDLLKEKEEFDAKMEQRIAEAKEREAAPALKECLEHIKNYGFTAEQLGFRVAAPVVAATPRKAAEVVLYKKDGVGYSGKGPAPDWIKVLKAEHTKDDKLNKTAYKAALEAFRVAK